MTAMGITTSEYAKITKKNVVAAFVFTFPSGRPSEAHLGRSASQRFAARAVEL